MLPVCSRRAFEIDVRSDERSPESMSGWALWHMLSLRTLSPASSQAKHTCVTHALARATNRAERARAGIGEPSHT